jgi:DNA-binding transcriptional regulator YdaS (Cro superfamily)
LEAAGGTKTLAIRLGITPQAVSGWFRIPAERVIQVEDATGVPRSELRPDLYPSEMSAVMRRVAGHCALADGEGGVDS